MLAEKRREKRALVTVPVQCDYAFGSLADDSAKGITINLSKSGICFYTYRQIDEGASLTVNSKDIWDAPQKATVKWCHKVLGGLYKIGLALI